MIQVMIDIEWEVIYGLSNGIFNFTVAILRVKVKVMHISTMNILEMVTYKAKITIFIK